MIEDWSTEGDYDPEGVEWIDVSVIGSPYQQQMDMHNGARMRHREPYGPWKRGPAPKAKPGA